MGAFKIFHVADRLKDETITKHNPGKALQGKRLGKGFPSRIPLTEEENLTRNKMEV